MSEPLTSTGPVTRVYLPSSNVAGFDWSGHALDTDYADQSHMARDCKANTGRTPAQLARDVLTEEADWFYRLESHLDEDSSPTRPA